MLGLLKGNPIRELGLTDKQLFGILESKGLSKKRKIKESKGDFYYKSPNFLVYYDKYSRLLYLLSDKKRDYKGLSFPLYRLTPRFEPYKTEYENNRYTPFALYRYDISTLVVDDYDEADRFYKWLHL